MLTTFLFCKPLTVFVFFFFALMQKRNKKNQGKTPARTETARSGGRSLRAFLPCQRLPKCNNVILYFISSCVMLYHYLFMFSLLLLALFLLSLNFRFK